MSWYCKYLTTRLSAYQALNGITVWALYPESNQRTLEEMDLLFAADTPWVWDAEKRFAELKAQDAGLALHGNPVIDVEFKAQESARHVEYHEGV